MFTAVVLSNDLESRISCGEQNKMVQIRGKKCSFRVMLVKFFSCLIRVACIGFEMYQTPKLIIPNTNRNICIR